MPVFDRGDVVSVPLDPALGHEQKGTRPALVLTTRAQGAKPTALHWSTRYGCLTSPQGKPGKLNACPRPSSMMRWGACLR